MSQTNKNEGSKMGKKEQDLFKQLMSFYDQKQYNKGIKTADQILKKYPNHGETQAMKGIVLNQMGRKDEAYELVKAGLRNDVRSHVCWHVYGLLYRSDNNYKEASKCYLNALRIDPGNQNIMRDLSWLQIQMRDTSGFLNTRRRLLELRPTLRPNWVAFAVANFTNQEYSIAFDVVQKYMDSVRETLAVENKPEPYEESELLLFQNTCLERDGKYSEGLAHLATIRPMIIDLLSWKVKQASLTLLAGQYPEAITLWEALVQEQSEHYRYHVGLQCSLLACDRSVCLALINHAASATTGSTAHAHRLVLPCMILPLTSEQVDMLLAYYTAKQQPLTQSTADNINNSQKKKKTSRTMEKITLILQLLFAGKERSRVRVPLEAYLRKGILSGIPSLCQEVVGLITIQPAATSTAAVVVKAETLSSRMMSLYVKEPIVFSQHIIMQVALTILDDLLLEAQQQGSTATSPSPLQADSMAVLWILYCQAHLLEKCGRYEAALVIISQAIEHTPTAIDIIQKKAKILKKLGDLAGAARVMEEARSLDLQDRYVNNKATKYFLKNGQVEEAINTIALFTKHEDSAVSNTPSATSNAPSTASTAASTAASLPLPIPSVLSSPIAISTHKTLYDLQCTWYEIALGNSFKSEVYKAYGMALKRYYSIHQHYLDIQDDLFDFHGYCMRKTTLRAYLDLLAYYQTGTIYVHPVYQACCLQAMQLWCYLLDYPEDIDGLGHLSANERKKERMKLKKKRGAADPSSADSKSDKDKDSSKDKDSKDSKEKDKEEEDTAVTKNELRDGDFYGEKLLTNKDFLAEASSWIMPIVQDTMLLDTVPLELVAAIGEVMLRRGKYLLVLRCLHTGFRREEAEAVAVQHPDIMVLFVKLAVKLKAKKLGTVQQALVAPILRQEVYRILGGESQQHLVDYVQRFVQAAGLLSPEVAALDGPNASVPHVLAAMKCLLLIEPNKANVGKVKELMQLGQILHASRRGMSYTNIVEFAKYLKLVGDESLLEDFMSKAKAFFPRGKIFYPHGWTSLDDDVNSTTTASNGKKTTEEEGHDKDELVHLQLQQANATAAKKEATDTDSAGDSSSTTVPTK